MDSIIDKEKRCYFCLAKSSLHNHHIIYGRGQRDKSEQYGLKVYLCRKHHTGSEGVHTARPDLDLKLKQVAQRYFEEKYKDLDFVKIFGKNYL